MGKLLQIPKIRITGTEDRDLDGLTVKVYTTEEFEWQGIPPKTKDIEKLPVVWNHLQLKKQNPTPLFSTIPFMPKAWYGKAYTTLKKPRAVILGNNMIQSAPYVTIIDSIRAKLEKANIAILAWQGQPPSLPNLAPYYMGLPADDFDMVNDTADVTTYTLNHQTTIPTKWVGGEILYMELTIGGSLGVPYFIGKFHSGATFPLTNILTAHVNQINESFKRYHKFGYHIIIVQEVGTDSSEIAFNSAAKSFWQNIVNSQLAKKNCTVQYMDFPTESSTWPEIVSGADFALGVKDAIFNFFNLK